ncbi:MAG: PTS glucose transporter subunit IIA [Oscillospiraceae bacterium]
MALFSKKEENIFFAPQSGQIVPLEEIPDEVFSGKVLGDGAAVIPTQNRVVAPVSGEIVQIADTLHAVCMESDDGLEILIHMGLETVNLKGKGFTCHTKVGKHVKAGELLMEMDVNFMRKNGYNPVTPCLITNMDAINALTCEKGQSEAGKTELLSYRLK